MQLNKATLSEQIYTILKNDILDQSIPQGEKLTLKNLQERFATSSTPIRDALTRLTEEGLVNYYSNVGVTVINLSEKDIRELYQFIGDMDALAIQYASAHPEQSALLEELAHIVERTAALHDKASLSDEETQEWTTLSDRFHLVFYDYCDNSRLARAAEKQRSQLTILSKMYQTDHAVQKEIEIEELSQPYYLASECSGAKDVLVVVPNYPSFANLYLCAFAHSRNKEYQKASDLMKEHLKQSLEYALQCI